MLFLLGPPRFPYALLPCAPAGTLGSAISLKPEQRPEEEQVLAVSTGPSFSEGQARKTLS